MRDNEGGWQRWQRQLTSRGGGRNSWDMESLRGKLAWLRVVDEGQGRETRNEDGWGISPQQRVGGWQGYAPCRKLTWLSRMANSHGCLAWQTRMAVSHGKLAWLKVVDKGQGREMRNEDGWGISTQQRVGG
jgi:hypothetical protein